MECVSPLLCVVLQLLRPATMMTCAWGSWTKAGEWTLCCRRNLLRASTTTCLPWPATAVTGEIPYLSDQYLNQNIRNVRALSIYLKQEDLSIYFWRRPTFRLAFDRSSITPFPWGFLHLNAKSQTWSHVLVLEQEMRSLTVHWTGQSKLLLIFLFLENMDSGPWGSECWYCLICVLC